MSHPLMTAGYVSNGMASVIYWQLPLNGSKTVALYFQDVYENGFVSTMFLYYLTRHSVVNLIVTVHVANPYEEKEDH